MYDDFNTEDVFAFGIDLQGQLAEMHFEPSALAKNNQVAPV